MSREILIRIGTSLAIASLIILSVWLINYIFEFTYFDSYNIVIYAIFIAATTSIFIVNQIDGNNLIEIIFSSLQSRPIILSYVILVSLSILWIIARAVVEWSVETNLYDYGTCEGFRFGPCGEHDLNAERRYAASDMLDKVAAGVFLFVPLISVTYKSRTTS